MGKNILNWGLLSTARINQALIPPLRNSSRNRLVGIASREADHAQIFANQHGIARAYGTYQAMLEDPDIQVVYNPLPNHLHSEWSIKALRAGKHVLCEKPLALSLSEVDAMMNAAQETGCILTEAFMYRHHPQTLRVKKLIDSGFIGPIKQVIGAFTYFMPYNNNNVRWNPDWGGGSLWDVGCYPVSYTRFILSQEPLEVSAWQKISSSIVDETFSGMLRFPGETVAQFTCSFRSHFNTFMRFIGEKGTLIVPRPFKPSRNCILIHWNGKTYRPIFLRGEALYQGEVEDLADAVLTNKPQRITLGDSRNNTIALLALLQSARKNRPVALSEIEN